MAELAVITPTYGPDAELFADLHRSVLEFTGDDTVHHVIVPAAHRSSFARYQGPRCRIWTHPELIPRRYVRLPLNSGGVWINGARPWPPVRGWIMQQAAKIAAATAVDADTVLMADSDVVLVRPVSVKSFTEDGRLSLTRAEGGVKKEMERHVLWHQVSRRLLGLPPAPPPPLPDYVGALLFWDPAIVTAMQNRLSEVAGRHWLEVFTSQLHISEFMLYGVFADEALPEQERPATSPEVCLNNYERTPMTMEDALAFAERLGPDTIGLMISSHSGTGPEVRRAAIERGRQVAAR
ncbi:DUF6492 family protein [Planomonospora venezuelensis]|uniref:Uncharacterized protein n=1 Tax=Planomonospora venezuelensis TaxID=1999 RepID=A0A841CZ50_PLAVE|nr:DUF6492 family protein [Planomonospora venezuelensis]MBB5961267.1 hypothetical protein [Planomonospora venezuelensis]GIM99941.1 hypothetical protein Pve01_16000 [Planomonospora venezuelensis]